MAYITVTSTTNSVNVDFGVYSGAAVSTGIIPKKRCFRKEQILFTLVADGSMVEATTVYNSLTFPVTFNGASGTFKVDSIDGVVPTSNSDLYDKLIELVA